jgi:TetR/AcrR family transcriptional regulator
MQKIENQGNTEAQILVAAKKVFIHKGFDGARMQQIADEAGINKSLLHYYFRTKEKLFEAIFKELFGEFFPKIKGFIFSDMSFESKIRLFIDSYIDLLLQNPELPAFILNEVSKKPELFKQLILSNGINPLQIASLFEVEIQNGKIGQVHPIHLLINMLSMCIFPFVAKPMIETVFFDNDKNKFNQFLIERKKTISDFIINSVLVK